MDGHKLRIEIKIFLMMFCLSAVVFSAAFLVYYTHIVPLSPPPSLSSENVVNFYYGMSVYFVFIGATSVIVHFFVKRLGNTAKIFVITFLSLFFGFLGIIGLYTAAFGTSPVDPLWMIRIWTRQSWVLELAFTVYSFFFLIVSTIAVIVYKVSTYVWRMIAERKNRGHIA